MPQNEKPLPLVLIVDDDALTRRMIEAAVGKAGYQIRSASSGEDALEFMKKSEPDLILLDVQMPGMNGFEVCEKVRESNLAERLPIIMLTGREDIESIDRAFAAGATDFISKPINWQLLIQRIRFALRSRDLYIELQANEERLQHAQRMARLVYWELDTNTNNVKVSANLQEIFNIDPNTIHNLDDLCEYMSADDQLHLRNLLTRTFKTGKFSMEHSFKVPGVGDRIVMHQGEVVETYKGSPLRITSTIQDITESRNAEETIRYQTYYDTLTGLPNRRMFEENLASAMDLANNNEHMLGLVFVGLDKIKFINDSLGHHAGDKVLVHMSQRLKRIPFASQMTARFEGDVFAMLYEDIGYADELEEIAKSILAAIAEPVEVDGHELFVTASIGISLYPLDDDEEHNLLKNADAALWLPRRKAATNTVISLLSMIVMPVNGCCWKSRCVAPIAMASLCCTTNPRWIPGPARWPGSKPWYAGTTRKTAWCRPCTLSPWRKKPALYESWVNG
jgi:diguanylate cyclase (GGDEF)-like protein